MQPCHNNQVPEAAKHVESSEAAYHRCRTQYGG
jgi:hypothetical protein